MAFSIHKWYMDVVTNDGRVAIAYRVEVGRGRLRRDAAAVMVHRPGAAQPAWHFSLRGTPIPSCRSDELSWEAKQLAVTAAYERCDSPCERQLLSGPVGTINWFCFFPRARARLRVGGERFEGFGYVERIDLLDMPPWIIPTEEIRWGRFVSENSSLVWIDWRGSRRQRYVFRDGCPISANEVDDEHLRLGDGSELVLSDHVAITEAALGDLLAPLNPLRAIVRPIARTRQIRWRSRGTLRGLRNQVAHGWALHEVLRRQ